MTTQQRLRARPKQERAVRTRAEILRAAGELFAQHGYHATSVQDVADRTGMTKGAVYFHFSSKEELALALATAHSASLPPLIREVQAKGLDALHTAEEILNRACVSLQNDPVTRAVAQLQFERPAIPGLPLPHAEWTKLLAALLTLAKFNGELREGVDPEAAARALVAALLGIQHLVATGSGPADLFTRWCEIRDLLFQALHAG
ncbi:ScbR family autoregulator-binding transcription factor [Streptomyces sp. DSM 44917]|uniref:ScbR family autoregulator-binding transcription factor n=1 Tax=Streptomyces boetiae TaxID=3075541 RepID=A0ABU2L552_9ACTN|nr:ScbR family autoregulator-binding transcription factor [Streptomyces sp. DSM 44917]MDT0306689.1 ScbR family autoregulator-binding transcription factor [Streptomyces sp. DSM 44917]